MNERYEDWETVALPAQIDVWLEHYNPPLSAAHRDAVDAIWKEASHNNPSLFDGEVVSYLSHRVKGTKLIVDVFLTSYRYFLAQHKSEDLDLQIRPLAVGAILLDRSGNTLVGRRSMHVTQNRGEYEFVPAGGICGESIEGRRVRYQEQLRQELHEETGLPLSLIRSICPLCFLHDTGNQLYMIYSIVEVSSDLMSFNRAADDEQMTYREYDTIFALPLVVVKTFMESHRFVPSAHLALEIYQQTSQ